MDVTWEYRFDEGLPGTPRDLRIRFTHPTDVPPKAAETEVRPVFAADVTVAAPAPIAPSQTFQLRSRCEERAHEVFDVQDGLTVGRVTACGIHFDLTAVSRHHAQCGVDADGVTIMDSRSINGSDVNGERIEARVPRRLVLGDVSKLCSEAAQRREER